MKASRQFASFALVLMAGFCVGYYGFSRIASAGLIGLILTAAGTVFTLASATLWAIFAKLDQQPPAGLTEPAKRQMRKQMGYRRRIFWFRYGLSVFSAILAAVSGAVLRFADPAPFKDHLVGIGTAAFFVSLLLAVLALREFSVLSATMRDLPAELEARKRMHEMLSKLPLPESSGRNARTRTT